VEHHARLDASDPRMFAHSAAGYGHRHGQSKGLPREFPGHNLGSQLQHGIGSDVCRKLHNRTADEPPNERAGAGAKESSNRAHNRCAANSFC
jgi:hypothetical protein